MELEQFEELVDKGIAEIPQKFLKKLKNVAVVVEDEPNQEQTKKLKLRKNYTLFGLYEGVPQIKRSAYYSALPDKITVFKHPIEQFAQSPNEIKEIVKNTVWHEIAHHFGTSEEEIRKIEENRRRSNK
jgi:predicted Zn-dependent protease with MMP-like domain